MLQLPKLLPRQDHTHLVEVPLERRRVGDVRALRVEQAVEELEEYPEKLPVYLKNAFLSGAYALAKG